MAAKRLCVLLVMLLLTFFGTEALSEGEGDGAAVSEDVPALPESTDACIQYRAENEALEGELDTSPTGEIAADSQSAEETEAEESSEDAIDAASTPAPEPSAQATPVPTEPVEPPVPDEGDPTDEEPLEEAPLFCTVKFFDADGNLLTVREVELGKVLEEEVYPWAGEDFLGWYPCDEFGDDAGTAPYDFSRPVEGDVCLRARLMEGDVPIEEAMAEDAVPKGVYVSSCCDAEMLTLGSRITLTAELMGYEGLNYVCHWQYADADRNGAIVGEWQDASSGELTYSYVLTEENILTAWRVCVTVH